MARFIARMELISAYRHYVYVPAADYDHAAVSQYVLDLAAPEIFSHEWEMLSISEPFWRGPLTQRDGHWAFPVHRHIAFRQSIVIYAPNEGKARLAAEKHCACWSDMLPSDSVAGPWNHGYEQPVVLSIREDSHLPRPATHFKVPVNTLVRSTSSGFFPISLDQAFETYRWMISLAAHVKEPAGSHHCQTMIYMIESGSIGSHWSFQMKPIISIADLKHRFTHFLLNDWEKVAAWRHQIGFEMGNTLAITALHRGNNARAVSTTGKSTEGLLSEFLEQPKHMRLGFSLNYVHPSARMVLATGISTDASGFGFHLAFGIPGCGSSWTRTLARTRGNEPFFETLERAVTQLHALIPDFKQQAARKREVSYGHRTSSLPDHYPYLQPDVEMAAAA